MNFKTTPLHPFGILIEPLGAGTHVGELPLSRLRDFFLRHQILILRGFETFEGSEDFARYCESWGEISIWPFGKVLELVEHEDPQDHIFDSSYVPMHWDGMYRPHVPEYQIFHCVTAPTNGNGGRTTFANTLSVLRNATAEEKNLWGKVTGHYERKMEFYNSRTVSPIITLHPYRDLQVIRYNEPHSENRGSFVNPPHQEFTGVAPGELAFFHSSLQRALYAPENFYAHEWQKGDVVITDNFSLLHGREQFTSKSPRHLRRVQVQSSPPFANPGLVSYR